jgi:hypothetical protein
LSISFATNGCAVPYLVLGTVLLLKTFTRKLKNIYIMRKMNKKTISPKGNYKVPDCVVTNVNLAVNVMSGVLGSANAPGESLQESTDYTYNY